MSNLRATAVKSTPSAKPRHYKQWLIVGGLLACVAIAMAAIVRGMLSEPAAPADPQESRPNESQHARVEAATASSERSQSTIKEQSTNQPAGEKSALVDDDGKTLWVSPTNGRPLDLAYLAKGAQIIAVLRPAAMLKHPEGEKIRAAFGPAGQADIDWVEHTVGMHLADIEQLVIGAQATSDDKWLVTFVVHTPKAIGRDEFAAKLAGVKEKYHDGKSYWLANDRAYYLPSAGEGKVQVVAPANAIADVIDLAGNPPPLRRDIERLVGHTDADRLATIIVAPNSLFGEGQSIFSGEMTRLRGPLFWFLGDELSGAALSMHWDENFFLELSATPTLDTSTEKAARIFADRVAKVPDRLKAYVPSLSAQAYGRDLIGRFPGMVQKLAAYTRSGFEKDHTVLRCYLPVAAGHNLLMAAELTLAEPPGGKMQVAANEKPAADATGEPATTPAGLHDRLAKKTSLRFTKDTLEAALEQLSQDIGVPIVIRGPDLQADGITKNQSFGIDLSNKPAEEILVQILRLANPDKSATGPNDVRQKLVYIIEQKPDKSEQIVITTRTKAAERHNELPEAFRAEKP